jgi:hypothetical protein
MHDHSFFSIISELSYNCHHVWLKSCIGLGLGAQLSTCPHIPSFPIDFNIFSLTLHNRLGFPHPIICGFFLCISSQPIDLLRIHIFHCAHGAKRTTIHDVVWNSFTSIVRDVGFHVLREQLMFFQCHLSNHIVLISYDIHILIDIVIVDLTHVNIISQATFSQGIIMTIIV